jgi:hypothetical protein
MSTVENPVRAERPARTSTSHRVGLVLAGLLCLVNLPGALVPGSAPDEVGPPTEILVAGTVLAVVGLVALVLAWRSANGVALRVLAACLVLMALAATPALFVDVPPLLKAGVALTVVVTVVAVVLLFRGPRAAVRD